MRAGEVLNPFHFKPQSERKKGWATRAETSKMELKCLPRGENRLAQEPGAGLVRGWCGAMTPHCQ